MKTRILMGSLLALMFLALAVGPALADGVKGVTVSPLSPQPDETITVNGDLLGPNSEVEVRVIGNGVDEDLGEVKADDEGDFTQEFRLSADLKPGTYQLTATGKESATTQITVSGTPGGAGSGEGGGAMGTEPVIETRPTGQSIGLVALFGVLAAMGLFFAYLPVRRKA